MPARSWAPIPFRGMTTEVQTCYRHDDRRAGVVCQRCDRPICPDCMHQASVGFHCPECIRSSAQRVVTARNLRAADTAPVTLALVALNVAIYIVTALPEALAEPSFATQLDYALIGEGFSRADGRIGVAEGEWYRLVTGGFLHGSLLHLGFNMYILYVLGRQLESSIGRIAFGAVYGASLLAGSLGVMFLDPNALTVGASGAVFGLFGYAAVGQFVRGINPMQSGLGGIIVLNVIFTFVVPGISIGGHMGGLVGGAVCGALYEVVGRRAGVPPAVRVGLVVLLGAACAAASIVIAGSL